MSKLDLLASVIMHKLKTKRWLLNFLYTTVLYYDGLTQNMEKNMKKCTCIPQTKRPRWKKWNDA